MLAREQVLSLIENLRNIFFPVCFLRIVAVIAKVQQEIFNVFTVPVDLPPSRENSDSFAVLFHDWFYSEVPGLPEI